MTSDLITRLYKLEGADGDIDLLILPLFDPEHIALKEYRPEYSRRYERNVFSVHKEGSFSSAPVPAFTASVDAAISLAERVLPNERVWLNRIAFEGRCQWRASLTGHYVSYSSDAAIALCISILRAKEAQHGE